MCNNKSRKNSFPWACDSPYDQILNEKEYNDPHNCKDSCAKPSQDCISCSNPEYFTCDINGQRHCIHPQLVCDGHPQCDGGEDEENCLEEYRKDAGKDATYICNNIYYPGLSLRFSDCSALSTSFSLI